MENREINNPKSCITQENNSAYLKPLAGQEIQ